MSSLTFLSSKYLPVLASFQNGMSLVENTSLNCKIFKHERNENDKLVTVQTEKCLYSGKLNQSDKDLSRTLIAVRNKTTNKVIIHELTSVNLSIVKNEDPSPKAPRVSVGISNNDLNREFGSKKSKRVIDQIERRKVNIENVKEHLETTITGIVVKKDELAAVKYSDLADELDYKPPIHRDATSVEQIYVLEELISTEELATLYPQSEIFLNGKFEDVKCCTFVKEEFAKLQSDSCTLSESMKIRNGAVLLYIDAIIGYYHSSLREIGKKSYVACVYSNVIHQKIMSTFASVTEKSVSRSLQMRDKCICYVMVLALIISKNHTIDLDEIGKVTKTKISKLTQLTSAIGAHIKDKTLCVLKLPIPAVFIKPNRTPRKR